MRALNLLRHSTPRREAFLAGLGAAGYAVVETLEHPEPDDVLIMWNRYSGTHEQAQVFEAAGGRTVVAENGHLGKAWRGDEWFSLAIGHHAGAGKWPDLGPERWDSWGVELAPWRRGGYETVIFEQRGYGEPEIRAPDQWAVSAKRRFGGRIRPHPGGEGGKPLEEDLRDARCALTWNSGAALKALVLGVPVFYEFDRWIGARASLPVSVWGAEPKRDDAARLAMFQRLAWAMWTLDEIRTGYAFSSLLR